MQKSEGYGNLNKAEIVALIEGIEKAMSPVHALCADCLDSMIGDFDDKERLDLAERLETQIIAAGAMLYLLNNKSSPLLGYFADKTILMNLLTALDANRLTKDVLSYLWHDLRRLEFPYEYVPNHLFIQMWQSRMNLWKTKLNDNEEETDEQEEEEEDHGE